MAHCHSSMGEASQSGCRAWSGLVVGQNLGVPFEALIPYAICLGLFGFTGATLSKIRHMQNGGKRPRHSVDQWDRQMMDRDRRLTGFLRGQTDSVQAPPGFELSNPWRVEKAII